MTANEKVLKIKHCTYVAAVINTSNKHYLNLVNEYYTTEKKTKNNVSQTQAKIL